MYQVQLLKTELLRAMGAIDDLVDANRLNVQPYPHTVALLTMATLTLAALTMVTLTMAPLTMAT